MPAPTNLRVNSVTPSTDINTGALHTEGGLSAKLDAWIGGVVRGGGGVLSSAGFSAPTVPAGVSFLKAVASAGGECSFLIDGSGNTQVISTGGFYINGTLFSPITSTDVIHNLSGAALGHSITVTYQKVGRHVTASFEGLSVSSSGASPIAFINTIPVTYRPIRTESNQLLVINQGVDMNDRGRYVVTTSGGFVVYANVQTGNFVALNLVGWYGFTITWIGT